MIRGKKHNDLDTVHGSIAMPALRWQRGFAAVGTSGTGGVVLGACAWDVRLRALSHAGRACGAASSCPEPSSARQPPKSGLQHMPQHHRGFQLL